MQTRISLAVIHINFAAIPGKPGGTNAFEAVYVVHAAGVVFARRRCTLVYLVLTVGATESWGTLAGVALGSITADPSVPAGLILASLGRRLTVRAMPALRAVTPVAARSTVLETEENMAVVNTTETVHIMVKTNVFLAFTLMFSYCR